MLFSNILRRNLKLNNPKISIITITLNSEKTIRYTLESIKNQKYENIEYIVIDGGSTDSTLSIIGEYISYISNLVTEHDEGISDAMNKGINLANGDIIGIIHSDDMLTADSLEILAKNWDKNSDVYYGHSFIIDKTGKVLHLLSAKKDLSGMRYGLTMVHSSTFVSRDAYKKYGLFNRTYKCAMDYELLLRFYLNGAIFKYIDQPLAMYRIGGTNMILRKKTINEVCEISIIYGGNRIKSNIIRLYKITIDFFRPILSILNIKNSRVRKI